MTTTDTTTICRFDDLDALVTGAAQRLMHRIVEAQRTKGHATVAITGGTAGIAVLGAVSTCCKTVDPTKLTILFGDERFLPAGDPERNEVQARAALLDRLHLPEAQLIVPAPSDGPFGSDIEAAAADYAAKVSEAIAAHGGIDIHLLGMGEEGHINSLFPDTDAVRDTEHVAIAVTDSPKPPAQRITLTLPVVQSAAEVWLLVAGANKAQALLESLSGDDPTEWPAAGAVGAQATKWFVDEAAASLLDDLDADDDLDDLEDDYEDLDDEDFDEDFEPITR